MFFTASPKRHTAFVTCREKPLKALNKVMDAVVKVLTDLTVQEPPDTAAGDARMYPKAISFESYFALR